MLETALAAVGAMGAAAIGFAAAGGFERARHARKLVNALKEHEPAHKLKRALQLADRQTLDLWRFDCGSKLVSLLAETRPKTEPQNRDAAAGSVNYDQLLEICDTDPEEGLRIVNGLSQELQSNPIVLVCRLVAHRRIIFGAPGELEQRFGENLRAFVDSLPGAKRKLALDSLLIIRAIEQRDASLLTGERFGFVMDAICIVAEWISAGVVQNALGWTKIGYFPPERALALKGPLSVIEQLKEVPESVQLELLDIRVQPPVSFLLAVAVSARRNSSGRWAILFALFKRPNVPRNGRLLGAGLQGFVTLNQGGTWRYDRQ